MGNGDTLTNSSPMLQLSADLANDSKHLILRSTRADDRSTNITRIDLTILVGIETVAHRFYVQSAGREYDVLKIAEIAVGEWARFLTSRGSLFVRSLALRAP